MTSISPALHITARVITPLTEIPSGAVLIENGVIRAVGTRAEIVPPANARTFNVPELTLAPGFIDLQLNGGFGMDFTAEPTTIWQVAAQLPRYGVTSFLPTLVTTPLTNITSAQNFLEKGTPHDFRGATPLGLHLEGPFLNPEKRGAHNAAHMRLPQAELVRDWSPDAHVRLVTLAPELQGALETIRALRSQGVIVSAGHSMATYEQACAGFDAGITYGTHLFNAMSSIEGRIPNLPGALLTDSRVTVGIIPDGLHVHPSMVALAYQAKGTRLSLVTDAMAALGMPPGEYPLGDQRAIVDATSARLADGRLAGSILNLEQALENFCAFTNATRAQAIELMTLTPARLLGIESTRGQIIPGALADLVLLTPGWRIAATFVQGEMVWSSGL